ncbi:MAG: hypothetical protein SynsKO_26010 [Synoicihabitans sp.]
MGDVKISPRSGIIGLVLGTIVLAVGFAAYTNHVWEDYYITFRSSQNLVEGHGLVYNPGERVHTFTSPLGVLLPALASFLTGGESALAALWLFRLMSISALAMAAVLLVQIARSWKIPGLLAGFAGAWLVLDGKTLDFTINGMETAFLVLSILYALWAHLQGTKAWTHQGAAWAFMMWTRPDCFIYIGLLALAVLIFGITEKPERRSDQIVSWLKAGLLTTVLYLPWFIWAWIYYGSPVPHTVAAKSGLNDPFSFGALIITTLKLPFAAAGIDNSMGLTFLPSYYQMGGWSETAVFIGRLIAGIAGLAWLLPKVSRRTRLLSFVFGGIHIYLTYFPYYFFPWYIPASTPFGILALVSLLTDLKGNSPVATPIRSSLSVAAAGVALGGSAFLTLQIGQQVKAQQTWVEDRVRTPIGQYLSEHAQPGDSVQMEPLGYIGYFSNLRTYDFPGMSSPEMVAARQLVQGNWRRLISFLRPDWVVIRPLELQHLRHQSDWRLEQRYELVKRFDQSAAIEALQIPGIDYLRHDAVFLLFKKRPSQESAGEGWFAMSDFGVNQIEFENASWLLAHAECEVHFPVPKGATEVSIKFGFNQGAELPPDPTDGARFGFEIRDRPRIMPLGYEEIYPPADPHMREVSYEIPDDFTPDAIFRVTIDRVVWQDQDWTMMRLPEFGFD